MFFYVNNKGHNMDIGQYLPEAWPCHHWYAFEQMGESAGLSVRLGIEFSGTSIKNTQRRLRRWSSIKRGLNFFFPAEYLFPTVPFIIYYDKPGAYDIMKVYDNSF